MTNEDSRTLAIGLQNYSTQINVYWNQVMAASLVVSVPIVIGFLLLQKVPRRRVDLRRRQVRPRLGSSAPQRPSRPSV